ncbi:MAG: hypothetical protein F9K24_07740 [Leptonema illini]|uniref:DUF4352 domain-containing protein n=1 Tax=Leptonema illini TaxID=183 RepID=A0A833H2E0_9LEPT|nr:MAG: hypothetical protein F9K24_07740 [Leptonema illini]
MKRIVLLIFLGSCVSAKTVQELAPVKNESGAIRITAVETADTYNPGLYSPKNPEKDTMLILHVEFVNLRNEEVTILPHTGQLEPTVGIQGSMPAVVDYENAFEAFGESMFKGRTGEGPIELGSGEAARRVFVFVYPKDKMPTTFKLSKALDEKKSEIWLSVPVPSK